MDKHIIDHEDLENEAGIISATKTENQDITQEIIELAEKYHKGQVNNVIATFAENLREMADTEDHTYADSTVTLGDIDREAERLIKGLITL